MDVRVIIMRFEGCKLMILAYSFALGGEDGDVN